jgi:putative ABC transport system permease protein
VREWLREKRLRWRALLKRRELDRDLEEEIRFHLEMRARRNHETGMTREQASDAARRQFGNPSWWKEDIRGMWSMGAVESVAQDVRYAVRSLSKTPSFAAAVILVLALGIGSTTAVFSMVNAVLLRSLPFNNPDELVMLWGNVQRQRIERRGASYPDYQDWKSQSRSFQGMAAFRDGSFTLATTGAAEQVAGEYAASGYFELLGIRPVVGRTFHSDEDIAGKPARVVIIGEGFRRRHFGSLADVLGRQLSINQQQFTIIGVLPEWFHGLTDRGNLWIPFSTSASAADLAQRGRREFAALARLRPGVTRQQAQTEMDQISKRLEQSYPDTNALRAVEVAPLAGELAGLIRTPLLVLFGAVLFVLLVACANVANLLLVRSDARRQEVAIRTALGASRTRVLRQLLTESVLLALTGAALGLGLAFGAVRLLTSTSPITLPTFSNPQIDWPVAAFATILSAGVGLLVGLAPILQTRRSDVHSALKQSSARSGDHISRQRLRGVLVVSEVAVAMTLLVGAGLLMRTFWNLSAIETGFDPANVLTVSISIPQPEASGAPAQPAPADQRSTVVARRLLERLRALPGVVSAAIASDYPFYGDTSAFRYTAEGHVVTDAQVSPRAFRHVVSPDFFATLRIPFVAGRAFAEADMDGRTGTVIVSESLAKRFWPNEDAIGKRIKAGTPAAANPWWTIVGVVRDLRFRGLPNNPTADPDVYLPLGRQLPGSILIRSSAEAPQLPAAVRAAIQESDRSILMFDAATLSQRMARYVERPRFSGWMMSVFAALALTLASVGLYGLMAYTVRQRTREFGIRIAMGATSREVTGMVVRRGMFLVAIGMAIGVLLAALVVRAIGTLLFGISSADPQTFVGVAALLTSVALAACYLPARRASRVDPTTALRYE